MDRFQGITESPHLGKWGGERSCYGSDNKMEWEMGSPRSPGGRVARNYERHGSFRYSRLGPSPEDNSKSRLYLHQ